MNKSVPDASILALMVLVGCMLHIVEYPWSLDDGVKYMELQLLKTCLGDYHNHDIYSLIHRGEHALLWI